MSISNDKQKILAWLAIEKTIFGIGSEKYWEVSKRLEEKYHATLEDYYKNPAYLKDYYKNPAYLKDVLAELCNPAQTMLIINSIITELQDFPLHSGIVEFLRILSTT
jgi:hypothetical protein